MVIFKASIKRIFKNKIKLLILLILPVAFIAMFTLQNESSTSIGVADMDNSNLSEKMADNLKKMYKVKVIMIDEDDIYDKVVSYQIDYAIILKAGFEENLLSGKDPEVGEFYITEKEKLFYTRVFIDNFINNMKLLANGVNFEKVRFESALSEYDNNKLAVINKANSDKNMSQSRLALGFLVQFMLYMSVITAGIISEDKNSGVFYRVFYAPVSIKRYLLENLSAFLVTGILQVFTIITFVKYGLGFELGNQSFNMYILYSVFSLVCVSLGVLLVSLFKKPIYTYIIAILITTPLLMLGGCYWPKEFMPDIIIKISHFIPTYWVMSGVDKLLFEGKGLKDIFLEIFILLLFSGIFFAGGLFRKVDVCN
jgi:ABC-2 type transport system permease protein